MKSIKTSSQNPFLNEYSLTRREFIKIAGGSVGVTLSVFCIPSFAKQTGPDDLKLKWSKKAGEAKWRIEGVPKVLGQKVYARDFKAADFPDWPQNQENWLFAIRSERSDLIVKSYDISILPEQLRPHTVIDVNTLIEHKMSDRTKYMVNSLFTKIGEAPDFMGQVVALLLFDNYEKYRKAKKILISQESLVKYGSEIVNTAKDYLPSTHFVRDDDVGFKYYNQTEEEYQKKYKEIDVKIREKIKQNSEWKTLHREYKTQALDPVFMEPESGLAWYDLKKSSLNLVLGTQSPSADIANCAGLFTNSQFNVSNVNLFSCYPGGGFGGRSHSYFALYLAIAAPFATGPLRWQNNRFEQFQSGLKRCETKFEGQISYDKSGKFQALISQFIMNSGGERNLSPFIAQLASFSSTSCYHIPRAISKGAAIQSRDLVGGSQRGFGGPQAFMLTETLVDEVANSLAMDPFAIRRKNLLNNIEGASITGAPITQNLHLQEVLEKLESHSIWQDRASVKENYKKKNLLYGVGLALSNQAYGTHADGMFAGISIDENGINVYTTYIEMGNGAATSLGLATAKFLGQNANKVSTGQTKIFENLKLTTQDPTQGKNPAQNFIPLNFGSSSACLAAFHHNHVVEQTSYVLFLNSILPAANLIWRSSLKADQVYWQNEALMAPGYSPIKWAKLFKTIKTKNLNTNIIGHASFVVHFVEGTFIVDKNKVTLPLDFLGVGSNFDNLKPLERLEISKIKSEQLRHVRSTFAPCGQLISVVVDPKSGEVWVEKVVSVLVAGRQISPQLVLGQSQGGIMMAISNVLFEDCPLGKDGPGNGKWNLHQYKIPKMKDMVQQELHVIESHNDQEQSRGIGEAVFCATPAAVLNAISDALGGKRFTTTPVLSKNILEAINGKN